MSNHYTPMRTFATLQAGEILRYHAVPTVGKQSVGEHSFGVAVICLYLTDGACGLNLLTAALLHDTAEFLTGDVPFTIKQRSPDLKKLLSDEEIYAHKYVVLPFPVLTKEENIILKIADTIEGLLWCRKTEIVAHTVTTRWQDALEKAIEKWEISDDLLQRINAIAYPLPHQLFQA